MDHLLGWKSWSAVLATPGGTATFKPGAIKCAVYTSKWARAIAARLGAESGLATRRGHDRRKEDGGAQRAIRAELKPPVSRRGLPRLRPRSRPGPWGPLRRGQVHIRRGGRHARSKARRPLRLLDPSCEP